MPIKWTADNDQILLLKILETSAITADVKEIAKSWPKDKGEYPTARAITERLVKIRSMAKANGAGHFSVTSAKTANPSGPRAPRTPRKPQANKSEESQDTNENGTSGGGKRKRSGDVVVKTEHLEQGGSEQIDVGNEEDENKNQFCGADEESPSKKMKGLYVEDKRPKANGDGIVFEEEV